jgi:hypothetical protein
MTFAIASTAGTGTVTIAANTAIVTGTGTTFAAGDVNKLFIVGSQWAYIKTFVSTTSIILDAVFATAVSGAAFSLANANAAITQTGTDANLSGLASVPGVYRTQNALATTHTEYRTQHPVVQAASSSTTIPAQTEQFQYTGTTWPGWSGPATSTLIMTGYYTVNGVQFASENYAFVGVRQGNDGNNVHIRHNGRVEILGCAIYADSRIDFFGASAYLKLRDAVIDGGTKVAAKRVLIGQGVTLDAINYRIYNLYFDFVGSGGVIVVNDLGGEYFASTSYAFYNENNTAGQTLTKRDFVSVGCANDYSVYTPGGSLRTAMINAVNGTVFKAISSFGTGFNHSIDFSKEVAFTAATQAGVALQDVQIFARDYNDGRRHNANGTNWIPDRTYVWSTDATGAAALQRVYTGEAFGTFNTLLTNFSYRSKNLDNTDIFGFYVKKYGYLLTSFDLSMKGAGVLTQPVVLLPNAAVTLSRTAALALTTLATVDDLLDRAHAWGTDPTIAILEYPSSTTMIIEDAGKVADAGARSIVIDSAAASAFVVNTSTNVITAKASTLAKGAKFDAVQASAITVAASTTVAANLTGPVTNAGTVSGAITGNVVNSGTISGAVVGNVTNTGTLASGASITGNLTQNTPTNLTGVTVTGDLIYAPTAATTITLTNVTHVGNIINNGTAPLVVVLAGTTTVGTAGANISVQVQCTVAVNGGNTFNLVKRYGTTGAFTDLGYSAGLTSDTFLVPLGQPVEVAIWTLGYLTFTRTIQTTNGGFSLLADMIPEPDVDVALDVSAYLANISVTYASGTFTATFNANMAVPGIEPAKAILHRLLGLEGSMRALLPPGMSTTVDVEPDEIQLNKPAVFLVLGAGATDVSIAGFFNSGPAKVIEPGYTINPRRVSDNLRVEIPLVKPALDVAALAAAVRAAVKPDLAVINAGVKKASNIVPHKTDLPA